MNLDKLPTPNEHGVYWFGQPGGFNVPAIMPIKSDKYLKGKYLVSLGRDGILFDGNRFRAFDTPKAALVELKRLWKGT